MRSSLLSAPLVTLLLSGPLFAGSDFIDTPPPGAFRPALPKAGLQLHLQPVATGLEQPIYVIAPPGSPHLYIIERTGRIRILENGALRPTPFLDFRGRVNWDGERGLLGLAFPPDYATNGRFYISYTEKVGFHTVIARLHADPAAAVADPASEQEILRIAQTDGRIDHKSGWIGFRPGEPSCLYIATGDGGDHNDPDDAAQSLHDRRGKLLRVDVSGNGAGFAVPKDNPFLNQPGALPEIWAYGLRNPYRCSFDRETADLFLGDVGQDSREEIDYEPFGAPPGRNYGWRVYEGRYRNPAFPETPTPPSLTENPASTPAPAENFIPPLLDYAHQETPFMRGCVIGGYVYRGQAIPHLRGRYVFGDFTNARIYSFLPTASAAPVELTDWTVQLNRLGESVAYSGLVSFGEDAAGELYVVDFAGTVLKITP
jgi:glucose/arabinose dehydrogenase